MILTVSWFWLCHDFDSVMILTVSWFWLCHDFWKMRVCMYWDSHSDRPRSARVIYSSARVNNCGNLSMYACVYVYVYVYVYVCMCCTRWKIRVCMLVVVCVCACECAYIWMRAYIRGWMYGKHARIHRFICKHSQVYMCIYVCMYVCMYVGKNTS